MELDHSPDELDDDTEIRQLARNSIYMWEFTNLARS